MMTPVCPRLLNLNNDFVLLRFWARAPEDLSAIEVIYIIIISFCLELSCRTCVWSCWCDCLICEGQPMSWPRIWRTGTCSSRFPSSHTSAPRTCIVQLHSSCSWNRCNASSRMWWNGLPNEWKAIRLSTWRTDCSRAPWTNCSFRELSLSNTRAALSASDDAARTMRICSCISTRL